jgi:16S rRNA (guanine(527)-N(7))-methyltransferase RsmG
LPEAFADILHSQLLNAGLEIPLPTQARLLRYCEEVDHWNQRVNLTSLSGAALIKRLVVEPVWVGEKLKMAGTFLDVGSGNGSPAFPLCLTRVFATADLVEARVRRAAFLRHLVSTLDVKARIHRARFEDTLGDIPTVDWITLQAVHPTANLIRVMRHISKPTTTVVWITSIRAEALDDYPEIRLLTPFGDTEARCFKPWVDIR